MAGWIKLHRKFLSWEWWDEPNVARVFLWLALNANHSDSRWKGVDIKRGQLVTSRDKICEGTGLTPQKVRTALERLKSTSEITSNSTNKFTIITICKYGTYNDQEKQNNQQITSETTNEQPTNNQQITTNKKNKEEEEEEDTPKAPKGAARFVKPTTEQVREYVNERVKDGKPFVDPEAFVNHYESNGWRVGRNPMKSWKSAIVTWEKRQADFPSAHRPTTNGVFN